MLWLPPLGTQRACRAVPTGAQGSPFSASAQLYRMSLLYRLQFSPREAATSTEPVARLARRSCSGREMHPPSPSGALQLPLCARLPPHALRPRSHAPHAALRPDARPPSKGQTPQPAARALPRSAACPWAGNVLPQFLPWTNGEGSGAHGPDCEDELRTNCTRHLPGTERGPIAESHYGPSSWLSLSLSLLLS